jgi:ubiquinone/menaquinone biosynthesis C-methylase UbiE
VDREELRRTSLANWETMASGWERRAADINQMAAPVREWLVDALDAQPGDTVLELAAGPGDTGFAVAARLGESGKLISSDFSPAMVEVARRRSQELGLGNVEHRVIDAEGIDLEDDSVDGVLCRFGYMLMPDPAAALAETRRVLRPAGRLALAVWREAPRNPWVSIAGRILVELGLVEPPDPNAPSMFGMATDERMSELLESTGFTVERLEDVPVLLRYSDVDDYVSSARDTGGMFARTWNGASEDERQAITTRLDEAFAPYSRDGRVELPGVAFVAAAT